MYFSFGVLLMCFLLFCSSFYSLGGLFMGLKVFGFYDLDFSFVFEFSLLMMSYFVVVLLVFSVVYSFSLVYFHWNIDLVFMIVFVWFLVSMEMLLLSGNLFSLILSWDCLGISSYYLVSFYNDGISLFSGLLTFLVNRFGDGFIVVSSCFFFNYCNTLWFLSDNWSFVFLLFLLIGFFTSSAQFPFNSWLPIAMSAPTPVSSLVHSSTLVTAGIVMVISMGFLVDFYVITFIVSAFGLITMLLGGLMGSISFDLSSLVAYSTLSQLGLIMVSFGFGGFEVSFFHMVVHAFFKSMMFIMVGLVMLESFLLQDVRLMSINFSFNSYPFYLTIVCIFNLCGVYLFAGWISSDLILEGVEFMDFACLYSFIFWLCCCLTFVYSFSMFIYVFLNSGLSVSSFPLGDCTTVFISTLLGMFCLVGFSLFYYDVFWVNMIVGTYANLFNFLVLFFSIFLISVWMDFLFFIEVGMFTFGLNYVILVVIELFSVMFFNLNYLISNLDVFLKISRFVGLTFGVVEGILGIEVFFLAVLLFVVFLV